MERNYFLLQFLGNLYVHVQDEFERTCVTRTYDAKKTQIRKNKCQ